MCDMYICMYAHMFMSSYPGFQWLSNIMFVCMYKYICFLLFLFVSSITVAMFACVSRN